MNITAVNTITMVSSTLALNTRMATLLTLLTRPKIGQFCNPATAKSSAIIHNNILRTVILKLIENAKVRAFDKGKKEGYEAGYKEGREKGRRRTREDG